MNKRVNECFNDNEFFYSVQTYPLTIFSCSFFLINPVLLYSIFDDGHIDE